MGWFISIVLGIITLLRMIISAIIASFGVSLLIASISYLLFEPLPADLQAVLIWFAKPLMISIVCIGIAYYLTKSLTKFQKFITISAIFILSFFMTVAAVSTMNWFTSSLSHNIGVITGPVNEINKINNMSHVIMTGI